ncbi:hypothetical protein Bca52824_027073 [Brassica carinata]|uniref:Uncharacterized protein n=1 Tax=Brassica carinata TaxID=52824 RepID=A0A8X7R0H2_BRACI|nr:hypothetical protein Bca52824_059938 [Brassica carinata]KAG2307325.1 hypothetical protein Bca52824_027073 [Brassica carinata]
MRRSNSHFKLTDTPVAMRFNDHTKVVELTEPIPTENFRFPKYEQLMLPMFSADVFGDVCDIKTTYKDETHAIQRVVVTVPIDRLFQACYMEDTSSRSLGKRCNSLKSNRVEPEYSQKSYWSTDRSENTCEQ